MQISKTIFFLILVIIGSISNSIAQEEVQGKLITMEGDTLIRTLIIPRDKKGNAVSTSYLNMIRMQKEIAYYDENGKKEYAKPVKFKAYSFESEGKIINMISHDKANTKVKVFGSITKPNIFLHQVVKGKITAYSYSEMEVHNYGPNISYNGDNEEIEYEILHKDGSFYKVNEKRFKKIVSKLCSDCKEVSSKIEDKTYNYYDIFRVVRAYNTCMQ